MATNIESDVAALPATGNQSKLRVLFAITSMPVGGAETLLLNLVRRMETSRFAPEICCLKEPGPLGEELSAELPVHARLLDHKYDVRVLGRLVRLMQRRHISALITVGAGDKMFWGRLAARWARVPVVLSALHSTGWPDAIGRVNRRLTPITDGFIAVAQRHQQYLVEVEGFPAEKVFLIRNGVDSDHFRPDPVARRHVRQRLEIPQEAPLVGIIAALRPEKNHALFLQSARAIRSQLPTAQFLIVGDGPLRCELERQAAALQLAGAVHFLGSRNDVQQLLAALDVFALTSHNEANPVSILEAMACGVPIVAPRVGSIPETVEHGANGFLAEPGSLAETIEYSMRLLRDPPAARSMGAAGRSRVVADWSLDQMVRGYQDLIMQLYRRKASPVENPCEIPCNLS